MHFPLLQHFDACMPIASFLLKLSYVLADRGYCQPPQRYQLQTLAPRGRINLLQSPPYVSHSFVRCLPPCWYLLIRMLYVLRSLPQHSKQDACDCSTSTNSYLVMPCLRLSTQHSRTRLGGLGLGLGLSPGVGACPYRAYLSGRNERTYKTFRV